MENSYESRIAKLVEKDPGTVNFAYPSSSLWTTVPQDRILSAWKEVPEYASDPNFILGFKPESKAASDKVPITVYVGVEGCPTRCTFCGYGAAVRGTDDGISKSLKDTLDEIKRYGDSVDWSKFSVTSLFIGGGTANILYADQLENLVDVLGFLPKEKGYEFGTEVYPQEELAHQKLSPRRTEDFLRRFRALGGNRINWAVQDFNNHALQASNRTYTIEEALRVYEIIAELGFEHINVDFLIGTRGHKDVGIEDILAGVEQLAQHEKPPQRISGNIVSLAYSSIPDHRLKLADNTLIGFEKQFGFYLQLNEVLIQLGFLQINRFDYGEPTRYEADVVNSAPRLAFGTGALGYVPSVNGGLEFKNPIVNDSRSRRGFTLTPELTVARWIHNSVFNGKVDGKKAYELAKKARIDGFAGRWQDIIDALEKQSLIEKDCDLIELTVKGKYHHATVQNLLGETALGFPNNLSRRLK